MKGSGTPPPPPKPPDVRIPATGGPSVTPVAGSPAGPSTPRPGAVKTKDPGVVATPTPMPSGPTATGAPTGDSVKGPRTEVQHGPSAKKELVIRWDHPVYVRTGNDSPGTTSVESKLSISREEALRALAGDDPRPLLVLRECPNCARTDQGLLLPGIDNERTILLARWFHCIKLPVDVVEKSHAFNALFPDRSSEHLFVSHADGSGKIPLESEVSRVELWGSMTRVIAEAYGKDPSSATRDVSKLVDKLDTLDARQRELEKRRDDLIESSVRLDQSKVDKVRDEIDSVKREASQVLESIARLTQAEPLPRVQRAQR